MLLLSLILFIVSRSDAKEFRRIVSLAPSCTEILADLGLQQRIVGITSFSDYPKEVLNLPVVGSYASPNLEMIVSLQPDLVVATSDGNPAELLQRLSNLRIYVHTMQLESFNSIQQSILKFAALVNREQAGRRLVRGMQSVAECIRTKTAGERRPSVLFIYDGYPFVTPGRGAFTNELIEMAGGESVTASVALPYPRLTIESVIAINPEVVIETSMNPSLQREQKRSWWKQYSSLRAVKQNRIYVLESRNLDRPSHRITIGFRQLAEALHPAVFRDGECR